MRRNSHLIYVALILLLVQIQAVRSQTTEFTYQGSLSSSGAPANGNYDFEFLLFDNLTGGTQVGTTVAVNGVAITNGVFSVKLNFGNQFISGANRFIEIRVRPSGPGGMTTLAPRQQINSAPYAVKSLGALNAESATMSSNSLSANNALQLGGIAASQFVVTTDPRMSDPRPPLPGSPSYIQNSVTVQASTNFNISNTGTADAFNALTQYNLAGGRILSVSNTSNLNLGLGTGGSNTSGFQNSFLGFRAGLVNTTGSNNAFAGASSGAANTVGSANSFFGANSGQSNTTGVNNSYFGEGAGKFSNGQSNAYVGRNAGLFTTSGSYNSFLGESSGSSNTTGDYNVMVGYQAGFANTVTGGNTFVGAFAGSSNSGGGNAFFGLSSGRTNTTGNGNAFFGSGSGAANTIGYNNTIIGARSGEANTIGRENAFLGAFAGQANTIGIKNVFLGANSGTTNTVGSSITLIGADTSVGANDLVFATAIGAGATVSFNNQFVLGRPEDTVIVPGRLAVYDIVSGGATTLCRGFVGLIATCSSSARYKSNITPFARGLDLIRELRPVSFNWKEDGSLDLGLVAEEVNKVEPLLTTTNQKGEVEGVKYDRLSVVLINALNEQQRRIEKLERQVAALKGRVRSQNPRPPLRRSKVRR